PGSHLERTPVEGADVSEGLVQVVENEHGPGQVNDHRGDSPPACWGGPGLPGFLPQLAGEYRRSRSGGRVAGISPPACWGSTGRAGEGAGRSGFPPQLAGGGPAAPGG